MSLQEQTPSENRLSGRASDAERERVIAKLREHTTEGRLSLAEFDDRLGEVYAAKTAVDIQRALRDLPVPRPSPSHTPVGPARPQPPEKPKRDDHLRAFLTLSALLIAIWFMAGGGYFWPMWPIVICGIPKAIKTITR